MNDLKGIIEDCNKSDLVSDKVIKKIIEIIGQEKWQELHDENSDICTTMGELIITLDGIADLEKENAELKKALKNDKVCKYSHYLNFKDLEAELTKAKKLLQFVSEYEDMTCYADELEEIKQFLKEVEK